MQTASKELILSAEQHLTSTSLRNCGTRQALLSRSGTAVRASPSSVNHTGFRRYASNPARNEDSVRCSISFDLVYIKSSTPSTQNQSLVSLQRQTLWATLFLPPPKSSPVASLALTISRLTTVGSAEEVEFLRRPAEHVLRSQNGSRAVSSFSNGQTAMTPR